MNTIMNAIAINILTNLRSYAILTTRGIALPLRKANVRTDYVRNGLMEEKSYRKTEYVNLAIIAVNFIYFGYLEVVGSTENSMFMVAHGAMFAPLVLQGEYWRLLTAAFMHFGIRHIINNMLILYVLGDNLERALGSVKYLIFYLTCGIGANAASLFLEMRTGEIAVSAGASGAVFGVVGGLIYVVAVNRGRLEDLSTRQLVFMAVLSLYLGFTSAGVNNTAHVAGLTLGIVMGAFLYRRPRKYYD